MINIPIQIPGLLRKRKSIGPLHVVAGFFLLANVGKVYRVFALSSHWLLLPVYLVAALSLLYGFGRKKFDPAYKFNMGLRLLQSFTFLALALAFIQKGSTGSSMGIILWVIIAALLGLTEKIALKDQEVTLGKEGVRFPNGFGYKKINWAEIEDVTLRTDFLTLHFPGNKLLQFELQAPLSPAEMSHVQDFCQSQVAGVPGQV